jgi:hypothetical protein
MKTTFAVDGWLEGLLIASVQAALMVPLILLIQWLLRNHLSARWRHAFWWLVVLRLVCPVSLPSPVSIFNVARFDYQISSASSPVLAPPANDSDLSGLKNSSDGANPERVDRPVGGFFQPDAASPFQSLPTHDIQLPILSRWMRPANRSRWRISAVAKSS